MNQDIVKFSRFIDYYVYSENTLEIAKEYLKKIFDAEGIYFHNTYINGKHNKSVALPIAVEGKNIGYCEIVRIKNKLSEVDIRLVVNLLSQFFTKIKFDVETSLKEHHNIVHDIFQLKIYQNNLDLDSLLILNCLIINIYDYEMIVQKYSLDAANYMMNVTIDIIKSIFNLPNDTIFKYTDNQIMIFITNKGNISIQLCIDELKNKLNSNGINVIFGLSTFTTEFDLNELMLFAQQNMNYSQNNFRRYY